MASTKKSIKNYNTLKYKLHRSNVEKNITSSSPPYCSSSALLTSSFVTRSSSNLNLRATNHGILHLTNQWKYQEIFGRLVDRRKPKLLDYISKNMNDLQSLQFKESAAHFIYQ